jgi:hypothetical protein
MLDMELAYQKHLACYTLWEMCWVRKWSVVDGSGTCWCSEKRSIPSTLNSKQKWKKRTKMTAESYKSKQHMWFHKLHQYEQSSANHRKCGQPWSLTVLLSVSRGWGAALWTLEWDAQLWMPVLFSKMYKNLLKQRKIELYFNKFWQNTNGSMKIQLLFVAVKWTFREFKATCLSLSPC